MSEIEQFLADQATDKRQRKIEELLKRPEYSAWWANKLCDFTGCNPQQQAELGQETATQWYSWIETRLRKNVPYDQLVQRIVLATGRREGQTYDEYAAEISAYFRDESPDDFSARQNMPHYWTRRSLEKPADKALAFAHSFLGIQLQCAQCHKHPFAPWTQQDFEQFSQFFDTVEFGVQADDLPRYKQLAQQVGLQVRGEKGSAVRQDVLLHAQDGEVVPWRELSIRRRESEVTLRLLRSRDVTIHPEDDPRQAIMDWMNEPENPWFAKAFVNRVWASYFHIGIVDPPDELNPANPPSHPEMLAWLTKQFVASGYDIRWLHREILSSQTYQRSWRPNDTNQDDRRNFRPGHPPPNPCRSRLRRAEAGFRRSRPAIRGADRPLSPGYRTPFHAAGRDLCHECLWKTGNGR